MKKESFHYMLRRTLPLWKWKEIAKETIAHCKKADIKEIIWMIDPEDFTRGLPTLGQIAEYLPVLETIKEMQCPHNILFSLNPWVTLGHVERGRDLTQIHEGMGFMTDQHGYAAKAIACPLSQIWRDWISAAYGQYASLSPNILWLEDDFRLFSHERIDFGCFCQEHLKRFAILCGKEYTREALMEILLCSGEPHPHRVLWLELNAQIMEEAMKNIENIVHKVDPQTKLGLMCSDAGAHAAEGRRWDKLMDTMCGEAQTQPVARPSMGSYNEFEIMDLLEGLDGARITAAVLPDNTIVCPELENCFYSTYAKSARHTRLQLGLSALTGANHLTMNLYDFVGGNIPDNDPFMRVLEETKPELDVLADLNTSPFSLEESGSIFVEFLPQGAKDTRLKNAVSLHQLAPKTTGWARALQPCGIPVSFEGGSVRAVTGGYFYSKTKEEIETILSAPLLLDGSAAFSLQQLGYESDIGVTDVEMSQQNSLVLGAEEFHNPLFGGEDMHYMSIITTTLNGNFARLSAAPRAQIISSYTDEKRNRILPSMTAFENARGGRIVVYGGDLSEGTSKGLKTCFLNPLREKQLGRAMAWLSGKKPAIQNLSGAYHLTITRQYEKFLFIGVANLTTDFSERLIFNILNFPTVKKVEKLECNGWSQVSFTQMGEKLRVDASLDYKDFSALKIYFV